MRNSVFDSSLLLEASSETRRFVPLLRKTVFTRRAQLTSVGHHSLLYGRQVMSFEDVIIMSPDTIASSILIIYGSGPDLLSMVPFSRTLSRSANGRNEIQPGSLATVKQEPCWLIIGLLFGVLIYLPRRNY